MSKLKFIRRITKPILVKIFHIPEGKLRYFKAWILISLYNLCGKHNCVYERWQLPILTKILKLKGKAVEVGVLKGEFSETLLKYSNLALLYCVDPWKEFGKHKYIDLANVSQDEQEKRHRITLERLRKYKERSKILRMTSSEAANFLKTEILDFIYIDANHSYEEAKKDIELWWPKLRKGGIFAGHDYLEGVLSSTVYGVKKAVDEFAKKYKQKIFMTSEKWPTWYLVKTQ